MARPVRNVTVVYDTEQGSPSSFVGEVHWLGKCRWRAGFKNSETNTVMLYFKINACKLKAIYLIGTRISSKIGQGGHYKNT
jgi:hypothetical protein